VTDSFDIATEGLLQNSDGQCLKTVVRTNNAVKVANSTQAVTVSREASGGVIASSVDAPVTIALVPSQIVAAERVNTQLVVQPGCASGGAGGVSSYNDLTDVPTEFPPGAHRHDASEIDNLPSTDWANIANKPSTFPPATHTHLISNITGLEPRIFASATHYTFDIDAANADNGVTDAYKFKDAAAAYAAVWSLIPTLVSGLDNEIVLLFGNGVYSLYDYISLFAGKDDATNTGGCEGAPASDAPCRFYIRAKNAPDVIPDASWSLISNWATQEATATTANNALIFGAFRVVFYMTLAELDASTGYSASLGMGSNFTLDGVAFMYEARWGNIQTAYMEFYGNQGLNGYAIVNTYGWWNTDNKLSVLNTNNKYSATQFVEYDNYYALPAVKPIYRISTDVKMAFKDQWSGAGYNYPTVVIINPLGSMYLVDSASYARRWCPKLYCAGGTLTTGYITVSSNGAYMYSYFAAGSYCPSGKTMFTFSTPDYNPQALSAFQFVTPVTFTGVKIESVRRPKLIIGNFASITSKFTGGLVGRFIQNSGQIPDPPAVLYGNGSPESVVTGNVGDTYSNKTGGAGTTLYVKESGNNTNTGWIAK
jgi:hypothetical protein